MRGRTPSEGRFVGTGSAHAALTIGSRALGASEPRQVRKEAALRTPSQVPRYRPIRASDADTSGDADLEDEARGRAFEVPRPSVSTAPFERGTVPSPMARLGLRKDSEVEDDTVSMIESLSGPLSDVPDYLERNREAWNSWASKSAVVGSRAWRADELRWGHWNTPESRLRLLERLEPGDDVVELGCGTAPIPAWLKRDGMHPVGVDFCAAQLRKAEELQHEHGVHFPLVFANVEQIPFDRGSFDAAISEYGASVWSDPSRWLPEAHRLLRPNGSLIFFTNAAMLMACTPADGSPPTARLVRDYFSTHRVEFGADTGVEFHFGHGDWIRLLRDFGFVVEDLIEIRPTRGATSRYEFVSMDWARSWPSEEIWVARKA
jgi:SAM-dependent methyltransferase